MEEVGLGVDPLFAMPMDSTFTMVMMTTKSEMYLALLAIPCSQIIWGNKGCNDDSKYKSEGRNHYDVIGGGGYWHLNTVYVV